MRGLEEIVSINNRAAERELMERREVLNSYGNKRERNCWGE